MSFAIHSMLLRRIPNVGCMQLGRLVWSLNRSRRDQMAHGDVSGAASNGFVYVLAATAVALQIVRTTSVFSISSRMHLQAPSSRPLNNAILHERNINRRFMTLARRRQEGPCLGAALADQAKLGRPALPNVTGCLLPGRALRWTLVCLPRVGAHSPWSLGRSGSSSLACRLNWSLGALRSPFESGPQSRARM